MDVKHLLKELEDIQETLQYELNGKWDSVPKSMQLDMKESIDNLRSSVYAGLGYSLIHSNKN